MSGPIAENLGSIRGLSVEEIAAAEAALALFTREHWEEPVPVLNKTAQLVVKTYFDSRGMIATVGSWPFNRVNDNPFWDGKLPKPRKLSTVLSLNEHALVELGVYEGAVPGPYFLGDEYIPEGAAVWRTKGSTRRRGSTENKTETQ